MQTQHTIASETTLSGVGLHTGAESTITIKPARPNHGFKFQRVDLDKQPIVPATPDYVVSTNRGTTLQKKDAVVHTVEHLLAALVGYGIDNALIAIDGPEVPILDGSAAKFIEAFEKVGKEDQKVNQEFVVIKETIHYKDENTGAELVVLPADNFQVTTMIDFNSPVLGMQYAALDSMESFAKEIAPCRTFVFLRDLEVLLEQNLIKGGDLDNAIVIVDRVMEQSELDALATKLGKPSVKIENQGILNTVALHFNNEPARHKLLDIVGDLALVGKPIKGKILATKPGHTANVELAKILKKLYTKQRRLGNKPKYDPNKPPIFDTMQTANFLPHRYPFLLVDKIIELSDTHVVGIKSVTFNEQYFQGHFPNNPVMPGVLQIEALAQTGGILALTNVEDPSAWDTYFIKIIQYIKLTIDSTELFFSI